MDFYFWHSWFLCLAAILFLLFLLSSIATVIYLTIEMILPQRSLRILCRWEACFIVNPVWAWCWSCAFGTKEGCFKEHLSDRDGGTDHVLLVVNGYRAVKKMQQSYAETKTVDEGCGGVESTPESERKKSSDWVCWRNTRICLEMRVP
ncbi:hypothetical protein BJY00DRAFT_290728 [Aspergillus carlsbadensis]|nr:hypothetical protein BJY00DRAFT_290728 [Aspergillus carlsbadensis]